MDKRVVVKLDVPEKMAEEVRNDLTKAVAAITKKHAIGVYTLRSYTKELD